jgi:Mg-chelatase subunit ChlD
MPPPIPTKPPLPPLPSSPPSRFNHETSIARDQDERKRWVLISGLIVGGSLLVLLVLFSLILKTVGGGSEAGAGDGQGSREGRLSPENTGTNDRDDGRVEGGTSEQSTPTTSSSDASDAVADQEYTNESNAANKENADTGQSSDEGDRSSETALLPGLAFVPNRQSQPKQRANRQVPNSKEVDLSSSKGINPFTGEGEKAKATVFVIDVSGSMLSDNRLSRVLNSLARAIDHLDEEQQFAVFLFDTNYYTIHTSGMVPATTDNKSATKQWLTYPPGGGGTEPMAAMSVAIQQGPERIVLLTDGEFDPLAATMITQQNMANEEPARIDCVGLAEQVIVLQEIASQNKGVYYQAW